MNKKGFTLVELLAIVALLALIVIVAAPNIKKEVETSEAKENAVLNDAIENASKLYVSKYFSDKYSNGDYADIKFTLSDLESDGLLNLKNNQCKDMKTKKIYIDTDGSYCFKEVYTTNGNCYTFSSICEERNDYTITYKDQDENVIQKNNVSCRKGASCKDDNVPTAYAIEGKEFIGWSNSKTSSSGITTINVTGDATYYAIYTDKYIINFVNNSPYVESISIDKITCIKGKECIFPKIEAKSDMKVIGWAASETSTSSSVKSEGKKTFNSAPSTTTYYALAAKPITIKLLRNNATTINASDSNCKEKSGSNCTKATASCNIFSDDGECKVNVPTATKNDDYTFIGYASDKNAHTELFYTNHTIDKSYDKKSYYAIVRKPYGEKKAFTLEVNSASTNICKTDQYALSLFDTTKYDYVSFIIDSKENIGSTTAIGGHLFDLNYYVNGYTVDNNLFGTSSDSKYYLIEDSKFKSNSAPVKVYLNAPCSTSLCSCKSPANAKVSVYFGKFIYE